MAVFELWKKFEAHQFNPLSAKLVFELRYKPHFGMTIDTTVVEENEAKLAEVLDVYEAHLAESKHKWKPHSRDVNSGRTMEEDLGNLNISYDEEEIIEGKRTKKKYDAALGIWSWDVGYMELGSDMEECPIGMVDSKKRERIFHELKGWIILGLDKRLQVQLRSFSSLHIDVEIGEEEGMINWRLTGFYGSLEECRRRFRKVLDECIDEAQGVFVMGRQITDNILIVYEVLHSFKRTKVGSKGSFALKLDISKAYDRVKWGMMARMGLCDEWISLVMNYDSIMFGEATMEGVNAMKSVVPEYESVSGHMKVRLQDFGGEMHIQTKVYIGANRGWLVDQRGMRD
ncbi:glutathione S-transferase F6-like [Gossypium australe]|uniref:glutathione transferase n=1 Tax=Gossypium australe TaxID=47621 RepID=A0A5B6VL09_9ROSI|nr:glutathione S-transferase F6-like [Gossypium australe]